MRCGNIRLLSAFVTATQQAPLRLFKPAQQPKACVTVAQILYPGIEFRHAHDRVHRGMCNRPRTTVSGITDIRFWGNLTPHAAHQLGLKELAAVDVDWGFQGGLDGIKVGAAEFISLWE